MSNDSNELKKNEELCEEKKEFTQEELEQVSGGVEISPIKAENQFDDYCGGKFPLDYGELHVLG